MDNRGFALAVKAWTTKVTAQMKQDIRDAVVELCTRIIMDMPVDMSKKRDDMVSKGDWNSAIGSDPGDVNRDDMTGHRAIAGVRAVVAAWDPATGEPFIFANYKDYIMRIEYDGWDGTPPYAPVGRHRIEWQQIVDEMARRHA